MYYVYILSIENGRKKYYIGYSANLKERIAAHKRDEVKSTMGKNPQLIYYEAYTDKQLAITREKGLKKSGSVYMALMKRLQLK